MMNMIGNLFQSNTMRNNKAMNVASSTKEEASFIHFLVNEAKSIELEVVEEKMKHLEEITNLEQLDEDLIDAVPAEFYLVLSDQQQWLKDESNSSLLLLDTVENSNAIANGETDLKSQFDAFEQVRPIINSEQIPPLNKMDEANLSLTSKMINNNAQVENKQYLPNKLAENQSQIISIMKRFESVLTGNDLKKIDLKAGLEVLQLLNQWQKAQGSEFKPILNEVEKKPQQVLWDKLVQHFEARTKAQTNTGYPFQVRVTAKDVVRWLESGVSELTEQNKLSGNINLPIAQIDSLPMSKIQQYIIHIDPSDEQLSTEEQFINRFQDAVKTSRFLNLRGGIEQLTFSIRPENLGEMTVKMARLNGEIIVKILVNSQATRQILETNMHQLRNTFAPHQVVIEDTDSEIRIVDSKNEQRDQEQLFEERHEHSEREQQKGNRHDKTGEELNFHDFLINEEV